MDLTLAVRNYERAQNQLTSARNQLKTIVQHECANGLTERAAAETCRTTQATIRNWLGK